MAPPVNSLSADVGTLRIAPQEPVARIAPAKPTTPALPHAERPSAHRDLVAGVVPGRVDFASGADTPSGAGALPMYHHPGDRNAAATGVHAGRLVDLNA